MKTDVTPADLQILSLGTCQRESPLRLSNVVGDGLGDFVSQQRRVRFDVETGAEHTSATDHLTFEKAGPREKIFFDSEECRAAIVTCGGLCPGINNVIRSIYFELVHNYGICDVWGIRNGYSGLNPANGIDPIALDDSQVEEIHKLGGTILGTSRGPQDPAVIVDCLVQHGIDMLFCVGGDGTQRGAHAVCEEVQRRELPIAIVGIPKTIDNDIAYADRTFGYLTALEEAERVLQGAHTEARAAVGGIALVKLMGRNAGFIAAGAALASQDADFVMVPEVAFPLDGEDGFLSALEQRLGKRHHAVVVVAEGAGQHLLDAEQRDRDASGNVKHADIGPFLLSRIREHFTAASVPISLKYIDPSYIIRSVAANCADRLLCDQLARNAVHAATAGKTNVMIGLRHGQFIHVPISVVTRESKRMDVEGDRWTSVLLATGQPRWGSQCRLT